MQIHADTLDDLLKKLFQKLLKTNNRTNPTKGGNREEIATLLTIKDPRARFSRTERRSTLISCLGETLWYFSGSDRLDFIEYYIPKYRTFSNIPEEATIAEGAYGPRLFGANGSINQVDRIIRMLMQPRKHDTRQAVIQIFDKTDIGNRDVPCTSTLQFLARGKKLHLMTTMRSNDAYRGLPPDVFAFTMLQEFVARSIGHEIGNYYHSVGSLHLYDRDAAEARRYIDEGWQARIAMPAMPEGDPRPSIRWLLEVESAIRLGSTLALPAHEGIAPYWVDLARLLLIKSMYSKGQLRGIVEEKRAMTSPVYNSFIRGKENTLTGRKHDHIN